MLIPTPISSSFISTSQVQIKPNKICMVDRILMQKHKISQGLFGSSLELDIYLTSAFKLGDGKTCKDFSDLER